MKLTGGEARGRRIKGPRGPGLRPTSDRVREALFDILAARVKGSLFLDAFAGTGAVGLEALSRGAVRVVFLERDRRALRLIEQNLGAWRPRSEILAGDVDRSLAQLARRTARFGIAFVDPPYTAPCSGATLSGIASILEPHGVLVVEHRSALRLELPSALGFRPPRTYRYGDTALTVARRPGMEAER